LLQVLIKSVALAVQRRRVAAREECALPSGGHKASDPITRANLVDGPVTRILGKVPL